MSLNKFLSNFYIKCFGILPVNFNLLLSKIFKKLHDLSLRSSYSKNFTAEINIENAKFKILLKKNDLQAQSVYLPLHKKKISYETIMIKTLVSVIQKLNINTFLDLGAFMGYYACFVSKFFDNKLDVYAIESNPEYTNYINETLKINNFTNVSVINEALSDNNEDLYIHKEGVYLNNVNKDVNFKKIKTSTLDQICLKNKIIPELLKIDVHGAEGKVIMGSQKILKEHAKVILLELHSTKYLKKFSGDFTRKKVIEILMSLEFKCYLISSFRQFEKSKELQQEFHENKKFNYLEIDENNIDNIFFDREQNDQFIFACKNNIDIKNFDCF